jgi:hypothetical protein
VKKVLPPEVESCRVGGVPGDGPYGAFLLTNPDTGRTLRVIASDGRDWADEKLPGEPWEHVSASTSLGMLPRWGEMQWLKTVFWDADETVIQIHPPDADYVNVNEVLHLWKPPYPVTLPPKACV